MTRQDTLASTPELEKASAEIMAEIAYEDKIDQAVRAVRRASSLTVRDLDMVARSMEVVINTGRERFDWWGFQRKVRKEFNKLNTTA